MILVIRHAQKGPDGNLTGEGLRSAQEMGPTLRKAGYARALTVPNARSIQTAEAAGLEIIGECLELGIPSGYETYMNGLVVDMMLAQPGKPWEKSYTRAIYEDEQFDTFYHWGIAAAKAVVRCALMEEKIVLIGSSPLVELAYLIHESSSGWEAFPRCLELEGFTCIPHQGRYGSYITCRKYLRK